MTTLNLVGKHRHTHKWPAFKGLTATMSGVQMIEPQPHPEGTGKGALRTAMHVGGFEVKGERLMG